MREEIEKYINEQFEVIGKIIGTEAHCKWKIYEVVRIW